MLLFNRTKKITVLSSVVFEKRMFYCHQTAFKADAILLVTWVLKVWKVYKIIAPKQKKLQKV